MIMIENEDVNSNRKWSNQEKTYDLGRDDNLIFL